MIKAMFGDLTATGRVWLYTGLFVLFWAIWMVVEYGLSVSLAHAGFLAGLSIVTALGPHAAHNVWEDGKKYTAMAIVFCLPLLFVMEFQSHAAFTAGLRGQNLSETAVQNVKYDGAQEAAKEDKANLELWKKQLATLLEQNAWAATVKADAMRSKLELANKEIADETARGGCKAKCNIKMKARDDLAEQIGKVEQAESLTSRIEATQRILDKKREVASTTEFKSSTVDHQNKFLAKVVAMTGGKLQASAMQEEGAQQFVNLSMAITATGLPALALFIAGLYRTNGHGTSQSSFQPTRPTLNKYAVANRPGANITNYIVEQPAQPAPVPYDPVGAAAMAKINDTIARLKSVSNPRTI